MWLTRYISFIARRSNSIQVQEFKVESNMAERGDRYFMMVRRIHYQKSLLKIYRLKTQCMIYQFQ